MCCGISVLWWLVQGTENSHCTQCLFHIIWTKENIITKPQKYDLLPPYYSMIKCKIENNTLPTINCKMQLKKCRLTSFLSFSSTPHHFSNYYIYQCNYELVGFFFQDEYPHYGPFFLSSKKEQYRLNNLNLKPQSPEYTRNRCGHSEGYGFHSGDHRFRNGPFNSKRHQNNWLRTQRKCK